ncbi:FKBP-type peptidyl-prolyl cis-trans isomerase [Ferrimonas balearica]|uniref:FKBP-type peptidyl-prolyl cis-trans isomerase n=1 Tax=Ferrimonas balearica TaxID=44012 RepID=UPI001F1FEB85|nr:FKBP-type peptidyl-prolyl cis-trans isomerase [Ferrimonas balearica]MBY6095370.1 FKBP-type peptidyl-prolyl cis-trans isomerase [Ferrimonas balearica]
MGHKGIETVSKIVLIVIVLALVGLFLQRSIANKKVASENVGIGASFLAENGAKEGVETTASGLQYQVLEKGEGNVHPGPTDKVKVHYHGTLIDGTVFDSSVQRGEPISFGLNQVIKGWTEGLQLMVVGDKYRLFIPAELAYGNRGVGSIPAGSVLIFDVELLGINQ